MKRTLAYFIIFTLSISISLAQSRNFVTSFSGPAEVDSRVENTWKIELNAPSVNKLYYRINWGDGSQESNKVYIKSISPSMTKINASHTYANNGNYKISLHYKLRYGKAYILRTNVQVGEEIALPPDDIGVEPEPSNKCYFPWLGTFVDSGTSGPIEYKWRDSYTYMEYELDNYHGMPKKPRSYTCNDGYLKICGENGCYPLVIENIYEYDESGKNMYGCSNVVRACPDGTFSHQSGKDCKYTDCPPVSTSTTTKKSCGSFFGKRGFPHNTILAYDPWLAGNGEFVYSQYFPSISIPLRKCNDGNWMICNVFGEKCVDPLAQ